MLLLALLVLFVGLAALAFSSAVFGDKHRNHDDTWFGLFLSALAATLVLAFSSGIWFSSASDVSDSEAFYYATQSAYERVITATDKGPSNPISGGHVLFVDHGSAVQMARYHDSLTAWRQKVDNYNTLLLNHRRIQNNIFTGVFMVRMSPELQLIVVGEK